MCLGPAADRGVRSPRERPRSSGAKARLCGISGHLEMNHLSAIMTKPIRAYRIRNVAVATTNMSIAAMSVTWLCRKLRQVGEGALGRHRRYLPTVAWLEQFAVDTGRAPERVGEAHLADQIADLGAHLGPSGTARSPPPIDPKAFAMPLDHGCRLDQHHGIEDLR